MGDFNPKWAYLVVLQEINKLGNEERMRSMLSKYMLDPKDDKFIVNLGVALLTEMRQELEKAISWDDSPDDLSSSIERRVRTWNEEEMRNADVVVKSSAEVKEEREAREASKDEKKKAVAAENKKRKEARKKKTTKTLVDTSKPTKVVGSVGGYTLESAIS